jgi:hypothetical protein
MTFMLMTKPGPEPVPPPTPELMAAIAKLTDEMRASGVLVSTGGLYPSAKGARLRLAGGKVTVTDGPFTETKEMVGGYAIVKVKSKEEALDISRRFMQIHADVLGSSYELDAEARQMYEPSDPVPGN